MHFCSKPRWGTRIQARDLQEKGSAFITSSDHWTNVCVGEQSSDGCSWRQSALPLMGLS